MEVLRKMNHPNITPLYEVFESGKYVHMVLPYIQGGELFDSIKRRGTYKELESVKIMHQVMSALAYLHKNNVVHRDMKPENLLLVEKDGN